MKFQFDGIDSYLNRLAALGDNLEATEQKMCDEGAKIVAARLKNANNKFSKYVKLKKAKHNSYGWYAQIQFKGTTESGASAALAASVYEHGRDSYNPQPARPFINKTAAACRDEVMLKMQEIYDEAVKESG